MPSSTQLPAPISRTTLAPPLAHSDATPAPSAFLIPRTGLRELALILVCVILCAPAHAQRQPTSSSEQAPVPGANTNATPDQNPALGRMAERMAIERNVDRQKQIVNDTARLLQLAQELNDDVSKSDKDTLSVSVVKKAEEIEKLAKSIKQKMRDGQ